jgi:hypothetical protein
MFTRQFWLDTTERAIKTAAQTVLVTIGAVQFNAFTADWQTLAGMAAGGAFLSVATSLASSLAGDPDTASVVD